MARQLETTRKHCDATRLANATLKGALRELRRHADLLGPHVMALVAQAREGAAALTAASHVCSQAAARSDAAYRTVNGALTSISNAYAADLAAEAAAEETAGHTAEGGEPDT